VQILNKGVVDNYYTNLSPHLPTTMSTGHVVSTETYREKVTRKFKQQPFVPIGAGATTIALIIAMTKMRKGQSHSFNNWLRVRIIAQGVTIAAVVAGSWAYGTGGMTPAHPGEQSASAEEKAREDRASFEERLKGAEEAHRVETSVAAGLGAGAGKKTGETPV